MLSGEKRYNSSPVPERYSSDGSTYMDVNVKIADDTERINDLCILAVLCENEITHSSQL